MISGKYVCFIYLRKTLQQRPLLRNQKPESKELLAT